MKKIFNLLVIIGLAFLFTGCSNQPKQSTQSNLKYPPELPKRDGKLHGNVKYFNQETGLLYHSIDYVDGKREGQEVKYSYDWRAQPKPKLEYVERKTFKNDFQDGEYTRHSADGKLQIIEPYVNGRLSGIKKTYYESGKLRSLTYYKDGLKNGSDSYYYTNGNPRIIAQYKEGLRHGFSKAYYENGGLIETRYFKDDRQVGETQFSEKEKRDMARMKKEEERERKASREVSINNSYSNSYSSDSGSCPGGGRWYLERVQNLPGGDKLYVVSGQGACSKPSLSSAISCACR